MKTFKRKTFYTAVLAAMGALGVTGSANAVQLSQDGTSAVLIYPYYTVRTAGFGPYNTYLNVVNTTSIAKVVKVRFLEGKNSREVLDFNLWLSPNDVWAGAVSATAAGAKLTAADEYCVTTLGGVNRTTAVAGHATDFDFSSAAYAIGAAQTNNLGGVDGADISLDRVREGYIEIIEMGVVTDAALASSVTHNTAGRPNNCAAIPTTALAAVGKIGPGTGGLIGGASLINVPSGTDYGYDPVVLEDFATASLFTDPGSIFPTLQNANPFSTVFYYHNTGLGFVTNIVNTNFVGSLQPGADAVSSVLERTAVMNNYVLDAATLSATDWVLTFPTKRFYIQPKSITPLVNDNIRPFGTNYSEFSDTGSCGAFSLRMYDREEQTTGITTTQVSPPVPGAPASSLCWESTVLNFYPATALVAPTPAQTLLGSTNGRLAPAPFEHGWARVEFGTYDSTGTVFTPAYTNLPDMSAVPYVFHGLPVIGFMAQDFLDTGIIILGLPSASGYGGNFIHKYTRYITGGAPLIVNAPGSQY